jgi:hypothetical protein
LTVNTKMRISVTTLFDCSCTGVTGQYRAEVLPFQDRAMHTVANRAQWNQSRNRQRNWETLQQVIGLRCQIQEHTVPVQRDKAWSFEVVVEQPDVFGQDLCELRQDCDGVPMITGLGETSDLDPCLKTQGSDQNIWFEAINN